MAFATIQKEVDDWISQFEEGYFPPLPMLARLTEEVGELARALMHHYGGKKPKPGEDPGDTGEEIVDLDEKFGAMMKKYRERDADRWTRKK